MSADIQNQISAAELGKSVPVATQLSVYAARQIAVLPKESWPWFTDYVIKVAAEGIAIPQRWGIAR